MVPPRAFHYSVPVNCLSNCAERCELLTDSLDSIAATYDVAPSVSRFDDGFGEVIIENPNDFTIRIRAGEPIAKGTHLHKEQFE